MAATNDGFATVVANQGVALATAKDAFGTVVVNQSIDTVRSKNAFGTVVGYQTPTPLDPLSSYQTEVAKDGPIAYWRFDDPVGSALAADATANGNHATVNGPATFGQSPADSHISGSAVALGGSSWLTVPDRSKLGPLGDLWVGFWFATTFAGTGYMLAWDQDNYGPGQQQRKLDVSMAAGKLSMMSFTTAGGYPYITTPNAYNDGNWHHVVATRDATTQYLYVDNVLAISAPIGGTPSGDANAPIYIGRAASNASWTGQLDELAIGAGRLSGARVTAHYNAGKGIVGDAFTVPTHLFGVRYAAGDIVPAAFPPRLKRFLTKRGITTPSGALTVKRPVKVDGTTYAAGAAWAATVAPAVARRLLRGRFIGK